MTSFRRQPGFDPARFLRDYWQQKPLVIENFVSAFDDPISAEELAGLACEDVVESRLIRQDASTGQWSLSHGPFPEALFPELGDRDWTLLVQAVDQWDDDVADLYALFDFLPRWRIDDIMVSFAAVGGGVGAHFDYYDVFLLQGSGQRRWQLGPPCDAATPVLNQHGISLLQAFAATEEYLLNPGDVLYVPARIAHRGIGMEPGLCYSIGFRAPDLAAALEGVSDLLIDRADPGTRFSDPAPVQPPAHGGEIAWQQLAAFWERLQADFARPDLFRRWFGAAVTRPRYAELIEARVPALTDAELAPALAAAKQLSRHPGSRFAFMTLPTQDCLWLFVDGEVYELPATELDLVSQLCEPAIEELQEIYTISRTDAGRGLVLELLNRGSLLLA
ncbi:MAG: cupin domain-containing protein [Pseudohongiellaceae bacterium]